MENKPENRFCESPLATRPILSHVDAVNGKPVMQDNLWAVTTEELNSIQQAVEDERKKSQKLLDALRKIKTELDYIDRGYCWHTEEEHQKLIPNVKTAKKVFDEAIKHYQDGGE